MQLTINIANKKSTIKALTRLKTHDYIPFDIKIINSHITEINILAKKVLFRKDTLFINSFTVWEIMQDVGRKGKHNYHGLTEEDIYLALSSLRNPACVFVGKEKRYAVITVSLSHYNLPLMIIIETNDKAKNNNNGNRVITIYPKDNLAKIINSLDKKCLLYKK